jgi:glycosyltransferase involved in cell wall biosynthesis
MHAKPSAVVVAQLVPGSGFNGFGQRLHALASALATEADVTVVTPEQEVGEPPSGRRYAWSPVPRSRPRSWRAGFRRRLGPDPYAGYHGREGEIRDLVDAVQADLVVLHLECAYLVKHLRGYRVVHLLEERLDTGRSPAAGPRARLRDWNRHRQWDDLAHAVGDSKAPVVLISSAEQEVLGPFLRGNEVTVVPHFRVDHLHADASPEVDVGIYGDLTQARNLPPALEAVAACERHGLRVGLFGHSDGRALTGLGPQVLVTGAVAELRDHYRRSRVVLVPEHTGSGVKTTVIEAWAAGRPLVLDVTATRGLSVTHEGNALVGGAPEELAALSRRLLDDFSLQERLVERGLATVRGAHSEEQAARIFLEVCRRALER